MNAQFIPEPEPLHEAAEKPGKRLRIARQARGLDQDSVAAHLHLSRAMIQALEQDNYDILPGTVFIRGYIRNYARLLGLDAEPLLKTFAATRPREAEPAPGVPHSPRRETRNGGAGGRLLGAVAALGVVALLAFWWHNNGGWPPTPDREPGAVSPAATAGKPTESLATAAVAQHSGAPEKSILAEEAAASPPAVSDAPDQTLRSRSATARPTPPERNPADTSETVAAAPPVETTPVPPEPSAAEAAAAQTAPPEETEAAAAVAEAEAVVFEFIGPCWVDIRDSTRKFKLFGEMQKGDRHVLGGIPPYSVILGNSPMVKIRVKGSELDLAALSRGNVARFTLDPNSLD